MSDRQAAVKEWIERQQKTLDAESYGANKQAIKDELLEQLLRCDEINDYWLELKGFEDEADKLRLSSADEQAFSLLKGTANRRLDCLKTLTEIDNLEDSFGSLANEVSHKAAELVSKTEPDEQPTLPCNHSQGSILAVRSNWAWILKQHKCAETHLQNAAEYHQFFYEVRHCEQWMLSDLSKAVNLLVKSTVDGSNHGAIANQLLFEMKTAIAMFLHWSKKIDALFERSKKVVPVSLRTKKLDFNIPVRALCSYRTKKISILEGEELTLTDNTMTQLWQVRNERAQTAEVPSVILLIPGTDIDAVQAALRLRFQFLAAWTAEWKRIGKTIIAFLLKLIREWTAEEEKMLRALSDVDKGDLVALLDAVDKTFSVYWQQYKPYLTLQDRSLALRDKLHDSATNDDDKFELGRLLVIQTAIVIDLLARYRDYWNNWEIFKILTETTRHPEYMLVAEGWKDYRFHETADWLKKWQLEGGDVDVNDGEELEQFEVVDGVQAVNSEVYDEKISLERAKETAETSHLTTSELEESQTFVITGVIDPRSGKEVSFDQAIASGIINQREGRYVNPTTRESQPIQMAMNAGKIKVEFTTVKKSAEKRKDIGLITIKTCKETREFTVKAVIDHQTDKQLTVDEAARAGMIDMKRRVYIDKTANQELSFADALDSGILVVEFETDQAANGKNGDAEETVTKTYAVHAVVNVKTKKRVTFREAVDGGLIDPDKGSYLNTATGECIYVGEAIKKGFIKATVVNNIQSPDMYDRVTIAETAMTNFRKKMAQPLMAINALKTAARAENGKS